MLAQSSLRLDAAAPRCAVEAARSRWAGPGAVRLQRRRSGGGGGAARRRPRLPPAASGNGSVDPDFVMVPWDASRETWCVARSAACLRVQDAGREARQAPPPTCLTQRQVQHAASRLPVPTLLCRDDESARRMADLMRRFEAADTDGCASAGGAALPPAPCLKLHPRAASPALPWAGWLAGWHSRLTSASTGPARSNGVIDREELRALLEHVGGGDDAVPMVGACCSALQCSAL